MATMRQIAQLGQPVLREQARSIAQPADPAVQSLIDDMLLTVAEANGVGIAARPKPRYPHAPEMEPLAMLNPELLWASEEMEPGWEGCLSIPGISDPVARKGSGEGVAGAVQDP